MHKVENRLGQPLIFNLPGRTVHLMPRRLAVLSDEELGAPEVQALLREGRLEKIPLKPSADRQEPKTTRPKGAASRKAQTKSTVVGESGQEV